MPDQTTEITAFTNAIRPLASRGRILHLLQRLASDSGSWDELLDATNQYQQELRNFSAYQRTETEGLVVEPIERKRRRRRFLITGLLAAAGLAVVILPRRAKIPKPKDFSQMLRIRPGEFRFQGEDVVNLGGFWIMEYEVTIAQYAEFLDDVEKNAGSAGMVAHPSQPVSKSNYRPDDWDAFYAAARQGKRYRGQRLDVNCPVFNVDWWDASAFARWRGQRLPTEQEWERAARGERELLYPWGNTQRISSANMKTNEDTSRPEGYGFWTPVDHFEGDTTAAGIKGLAGNVEEWTESLAQHPDYPDRQVPVVRGGSFATEPDYDLTRRRAAESFKETSLARGFRTVSDIDPS